MSHLEIQHDHVTPASTHFGAQEIGWQALGPTIALTTVATGVVALRWYTRWRLARCVGVDDFVILFSMILSWCMCAIIGAELNEGLGVFEGGRPVDAPHLAKLVIINNDLWALAVTITKASILAQYLRVFSCRIVRCLCYVLYFLLIPAVLWSIFAGTFLCRPVAKLWNPQIPGECMNAHTYWLSAAGTNIGLDFLVLLLPLPAITSLHLPRRQKICIVLVFLLGFFVCIVSIVRLLTVFLYAKAGELVESGIQAVTWSAIEANVGIICASLLALKPLLLHVCPCLLDSESVPSHRLRLPTMQTCHVEDGTGSDAPVMQQRNAPSSPTASTAQHRASTVQTKESGSMVQRSSLAATLTGVPRTEGLSFVDMLADGPERGDGR